MRTFFSMTAFALALGLIVAAVGCGSGDSEVTPAADTETGSPGETASSEDGSESITGFAGNTEPPLPEVSQAVDSVPKAGTDQLPAGESEITITAVSPEQFQAALAKHKGKVILVDFWASWCKPCVKGLPHTTELAHKNADRGLVVLTMSMDDVSDPEEKAKALKKLKENNVNLENYICTLGGGDESAAAYNIGDSGLPHYKIYDRTGKLAKELRNDIDAGIAVAASDVDEHVEKLLAAE